MPLRPLGLGDMYDAAFKIIRYNAAATVGSAVLVTAAAMVLPVVIAAAVGGSGLSLDPESLAAGTAPTEAQLVGFFASTGSLMLGAVLQGIGLILVTGMIAHVAMAATLGRRMTLGEAWAATHGQRWRLIGLTLLLGLLYVLLVAVYAALWVGVVAAADGAGAVVVWGILTVPLFLVVLVLFYIRIAYLAAPALILEELTVGKALGRARALSAKAFWRTFGIALLTGVIGAVASALLGAPISLVGQALTSYGGVDPGSVVLLVVSQAASSVVSAAFVTPFVTAVSCLQYLDHRIRKEGFDVELVTRAGLPQP